MTTSRLANIFFILAVVAYSCIILYGQMIALPFCMFIIFSLMELGTLNQLTSVLAIIGFVILISTFVKTNAKTKFILQLLASLLLFAPLLNRFTDVPLRLFNYPAFTWPFYSFILLYILALLLSAYSVIQSRKVRRNKTV